METTKSITKERLRDLLLSEMKLECLEDSGIDNWEWYAETMTKFEKLCAEYEDEARYEELLAELEVALLDGVYEPSDHGAGYTCTETARRSAMKVLETYKVSFRAESG